MPSFLDEIAHTLAAHPASGEFRAAGVLIKSIQTNRYLFVQRGDHVKQARTWAGFGGEIDPGETPEDAIIRELEEEAGFTNAVKLKKVYTFVNGGFTYHNYIGTVWNEFEPKLNWENMAYIWCNVNDLPEPLHPGIKEMLKTVKLA
jgi:8-oxo-dGTP pyrophosphatase MutT (NUDIX family)